VAGGLYLVLGRHTEPVTVPQTMRGGR
jgi:hypothetical protein